MNTENEVENKNKRETAVNYTVANYPGSNRKHAISRTLYGKWISRTLYGKLNLGNFPEFKQWSIENTASGNSQRSRNFRVELVALITAGEKLLIERGWLGGKKTIFLQTQGCFNEDRRPWCRTSRHDRNTSWTLSELRKDCSTNGCVTINHTEMISLTTCREKWRRLPRSEIMYDETKMFPRNKYRFRASQRL